MLRYFEGVNRTGWLSQNGLPFSLPSLTTEKQLPSGSSTTTLQHENNAMVHPFSNISPRQSSDFFAPSMVFKKFEC
jgi:hypothetical protein